MKLLIIKKMMKCVVGVRYIKNVIFFIEDFIDKIQVKNSILETRVKNSDIKETIKKEIEDEDINNQNNDEVCSGCEIY